MRLRFFFGLFLLALFLTVQAIPGPIVTSSTHPEQDKWYRDNSPKFSFVLEGATAYSYDFDLAPDTVPDDVSEGSESAVSLSNKTNGAWYFHVKARVGGQWTDAAHYAAKIDRTAPLPPTNLALEAIDSSSIKLSWTAAVDSASGIKGYKIYRALLTGFNITDSTTTVVAELVEGESYVDSGLNEGVYYHYKVQSIDNANNMGGTSNEAISRTATTCDLVMSLEGVFEEGVFNLRAQTDDSLFAAYLRVTLPQADVNNVFSNISGKNDFSYSFDLSETPQGSILVEFGGRDREGDDCVVQKTFYFDTVFPTLQWVFPRHRDVLKNLVQLKVSAVDQGEGSSGIEKVEYFLDSQPIGEAVFLDGFFVFDWNSLNVENAGYDLTVKASDFGGNFVEETIFVTVENTALLEAQASSLIAQANSSKEVALELKNRLESLGFSSKSFESFFNEGESKFLSASDALDKGVNLNRAVLDAQASLESFNNAASSVTVSKEDTVVFVFRQTDLEQKYLRAGLKKEFLPQAVDNVSEFSPQRRLDIFKIIDGNTSVYRAGIFVSLTPTDSNFSGVVKVVELVEKNLTSSASEISSPYDFSILVNDPVLLFEIDLNKSKEFSYFLNKDLSSKEVNELSAAKPDEFFIVPPVVLPASVSVPADILVKPLDLFAFFKSSFGGDLALFSAFSLGVMLVVLFILAIVSVIVIAFIVMRTKRKGL